MAWHKIMTRIAIVIQRYWRGFHTRKVNAELIKKIKNAWLLLKQTRAAIKIQKNWRRYHCRKLFLQQMAAIKIQKNWKMYICRKKFLK